MKVQKYSVRYSGRRMFKMARMLGVHQFRGANK